MIRIAVVEDDAGYANILKGYISRYAKDTGKELFVKHYSDGIDFLTEYNNDFQIIFMDIDMPHMNGLATAAKLREQDKQVCLVFVTNLARLAIRGYEVDAIDFVVKPVSEYVFRVKLEKALRYAKINQEDFLVLSRDDKRFRVSVSEIYYVEKDKNYLVYHTAKGEFRRRGSMQSVEGELIKDGFGSFAKSMSGCLLNMNKVTKITPVSVFVNDEELPISRPMHKEFMDRMMKFYRDGK